MTAVWYRFRAELRARWKAVVVLAVLAGIAGGVTLAAIAGARRTDSAFSRLLTATDAAQVLVNPDDGNDSKLDPKAVARLPMVSDAGVERGLIVVPLPLRKFADVDTALSMGSDGHVGYSMARLHVVEGRMPDTSRADEVLVNRRFADHYGVDVGSVFDAAIVTRDDFAAFEEQHISLPAGIAAINRGEFGTRIRLRVSGIGETPESLVLDEGFEQLATVLAPAFQRRYPHADAGFFGVAVRLRHGVADLPAFKRAVQALPHEGAIEFQTLPVTEAKVSRAVRPSVGALTVFALVIALTGLLLVGQAIARQTFLDSVDHPTLRALGFGRVQLVVTTMLRGAVVAVAAAALAVVIAVAASPLTPIGVARGIEPDPGLSFDGAVLGLGFVGVLVAVARARRAPGVVVHPRLPLPRRRPGTGATVAPRRVARRLRSPGGGRHRCPHGARTRPWPHRRARPHDHRRCGARGRDRRGRAGLRVEPRPPGVDAATVRLVVGRRRRDRRRLRSVGERAPHRCARGDDGVEGVCARSPTR